MGIFTPPERVGHCISAPVQDLECLNTVVACVQEQCRREMFAGRVFRYIREAPITFHPTYKFDKHTSTYDTSEKQRVPAWTDRIFFRGSAFIKNASEV